MGSSRGGRRKKRADSITSFEEIQRLVNIFPTPLIALKAYAAYIKEIEPDNVEYRDACFYDYILRCNAYALRELQRDRGAVGAARDYFHLALQLFMEVKEVCCTGLPSMPPSSSSGALAGDGEDWSRGKRKSHHHDDDDDDENNKGEGESEEMEAVRRPSVTQLSALRAEVRQHRRRRRGGEEGDEEDVDEDEEDEDGGVPSHRHGTLLIPNTVEDGALTLLSITFSNWACAELTGKNPQQAFALLELLNYFSPSADETSMLGYRVDTVSHINAAICEVMRCNFPEASSILHTITKALSERADELAEKVAIHEQENSRSGFISIAEAAKLTALPAPIQPTPSCTHANTSTARMGAGMMLKVETNEGSAGEGEGGMEANQADKRSPAVEDVSRPQSEANDNNKKKGEGEGEDALLLGEMEPVGGSADAFDVTGTSGAGQGMLLAGGGTSSQGDSHSPIEDEVARELWDVHALQGLVHYSAGVATEYTDGEVAELHYIKARHYFELAGILVEPEEAPRAYLARALDETARKLSELLSDFREREDGLDGNHTDDGNNNNNSNGKRKDSSKAKKGPKTTAGGAATGAGGKKKKKGGGGDKHVAAAERPHFVAPPIQSGLRNYICSEGLPVVPAALFRLDDALRTLLPLTACDDFVSPLCSAQADEHYYVAAAFLPIETPLAWAITVSTYTKAKVRPSVWTPKESLPGYLQPRVLADEVPLSSYALRGGTHTAGDTTGGSTVAGGGGGNDDDLGGTASGAGKLKMPKPMVKSLMPRPLPQATIDAAEQGLNAALKLVNNRLITLIKAEKAFEDRWSATERIKNALQAYYVPQMMLWWKEKKIRERNFTTIQRDHAARVLQHFFRLVVEVKPRQYGFKSAPERREKERHDAAIVLQKYARRYLALRERREREKRRDERVRRVTTLQSLWRRRLAVRAVERIRAARAIANAAMQDDMTREFSAILIQRNYRRHLTQLLLWEYKGEKMRALKHHLHDSRHYYATVIQTRVRGMLVRKVYGKAVHAKRCYGRNKYWSGVYNAACVTIQRVFRGWRTRQDTKTAMYFCHKHIQDRKTAASEAILAAERAEKAAEDRTRALAAARIQSLVRMVIAKREVRQRQEERALADAAVRAAPPVPVAFSLKDCEY